MTTSKIHLTAAAACFLLALAVPTVAITVGEDTTSDDIVLESTSQYASTENSTLRLNLEAINARAVTHVDNSFTITVNDDAAEAIWISNNVDGLEFYVNGDRTAEITESNPLNPSTGETVRVGVKVDTYNQLNRTGNFTVTVQYEEDEPRESGGSTASPTIEASNLTVSPPTLETGETTTVNATYRNLGETETVTSRLTVDGTVVDQQSIDLEPGETETVSFERRMDWPGTYDVGIAGVGTESVTVEGPPIDIVDATIDDTELTAGESTAIRATVRNPTDTAVDRTLEVAIDGIVVDSRAVTIPANGERTVVFDRRFDEAGTYEIDVSGVDAGTVTVDERPTLSIRNRELSAATTAAIAPPATAGLLFLAMAANRRWAFVR